MKISVITPTYNSEKTLRETIESVRAQQDATIEHIIMDGGSTDQTSTIVAEYDHLIWRSEPDEGHYDAMNKGIALATGEIVAVLNSDDTYCPGALAAISKAFQTHTDWDGLFGDLIVMDGESREIYHRKEARYDYDVLRFGWGYVIHPTFFLRKPVFEKLGGFNHKRFLNCADFDLIIRAGKEGFSIGHIPQFIASYRIHDFGQTADRRIQKNMARECLIIQREHGKAAGLVGRLQTVVARAKRQGQKLRYRRTCDIIPGHWKFRRLTRNRTTFSSNIGLDQLPDATRS